MQPRWSWFFVVSFASSACASAAPTFDTIEQPPAPKSEDASARTPTETLIVAPPEAERTQLVEQLFLALSIGNETLVEKLLWPEARIGRINQSQTLATRPALSELLSMFAAGPREAGSPSTNDELAFVSAEIVDLSERRGGTQSEFSVLVAGASPIEGTWKITLEHVAKLRIVSVLLPAQD